MIGKAKGRPRQLMLVTRTAMVGGLGLTRLQTGSTNISLVLAQLHSGLYKRAPRLGWLNTAGLSLLTCRPDEERPPGNFRELFQRT